MVADTPGGSLEDSGMDGPEAGPCDLNKPFENIQPVVGIAKGGAFRLSPDHLTAYFSTLIAGGTGVNDLYQAIRSTPDSAFQPATELVALNTVADDVIPTVSGDGKTMVFLSSRGGGDGLFNLYIATRADATAAFTTATRLVALDTPGTENDPYLVEDGSALYYQDGAIVRAALTGSGFANPVNVNLGPAASPVVSPDELTIYFATNRPDPGSQGDLDIWVARRTTTSESFGTAKLLAELNTSLADRPRFITADGCTIYFERGTDGPPLFATRPK